ncbi:MAG: SDR family oxidoreductase [Deltaproteobacteria bacterium]|nr:SDR family oxidoreductase [Deltaproteobacteria bacterium]
MDRATNGYRVFRDKIAVITGAASGLGQGFAIEIGKAGGMVVAADINFEGVAQTVATIVAAGGKGEAHRLDVRDSRAVTALVDATVANHGRLDYIFNNAGIATLGLTEEIPIENWDEIIDINLKGVVYGTAAAYRHMVRQGSGHIVNTASLAGLVPSPLLAPYSTVKFGVVGLSDSLRVEAQPKGITVTALCPGFIESGIYGATRSIGNFNEQILRENIPGIVPLDKGVRQLLDGVVRKKRIVTLPLYAHVMIWLYKIFPGLALELSAKLAERQTQTAAERAKRGN